MQRQTRTDLSMSAAVVFLGASLAYSGCSLLRLHWHSAGRATGLALPELLGIGAAGTGIALLCWWLFALVCAFISAIAHGRGSGRVASVTGSLAPAFMRRVVAAVLGLNLLAAPLANAAQVPGTPAVDPLWHAQPAAAAVAPANSADPLPEQESEGVAPAWVPQTAQTHPDLLMRSRTRETSGATEAVSARQAPASECAAPAGTAPGEELDVVVRQGDTLWSIVAAALGPYASDADVAQSWPDWYRVNRDTIGTDPNIVLPGQILHAP